MDLTEHTNVKAEKRLNPFNLSIIEGELNKCL